MSQVLQNAVIVGGTLQSSVRRDVFAIAMDHAGPQRRPLADDAYPPEVGVTVPTAPQSTAVSPATASLQAQLPANELRVSAGVSTVSKMEAVYKGAQESLAVMQGIFTSFDPSLNAAANRTLSEHGGSRHSLAEKAEQEYHLRSLKAKTKHAQRRREQLKSPTVLHPAPLEGETLDSGLAALLRPPLSPVGSVMSEGADERSDASDDEDDELCKQSRWERKSTNDLDDGGQASPELIAHQRALISSAIEARAEELQTIGQLLREFHDDQQSRAHELDVMQSQRYQELLTLGRMISGLVDRRNAASAAYEMDLRMKMADLPLALLKAPKSLRDVSTNTTGQTEVSADGRGMHVDSKSPQAGSLTIVQQDGAGHRSGCGGLSAPPPCADATNIPNAILSKYTEALPAFSKSATSGHVSQHQPDVVFLVSGRFGEPGWGEALWKRDQVGFIAATSQFLRCVSATASKPQHRSSVYISTATRSGFLASFACASSAFAFVQDLDACLVQSRWDAHLRSFPETTVVTEGDVDAQTLAFDSTVNTANSGHHRMIFNGPRLAAVLFLGRANPHNPKSRLRCDVNPATLSYDYTGSDIRLMEELLSVTRGGECVTTRDVWRCVLMSGMPPQAAGAVLLETAYGVGAGDIGASAKHLAEATQLQLLHPLKNSALSSKYAFYFKVLKVYSFENRGRATVLGPHPLQIGERQLIQPAIIVGHGVRSHITWDEATVPGEGDPDSLWLRCLPKDSQETNISTEPSETSASVALETALWSVPPLSLSAPHGVHVASFRRATDASHNGVVSISLPYAVALLQQPFGAACLKQFTDVMWTCALKAAVLCTTAAAASQQHAAAHPSCRIHVSTLLHHDAFQSPLHQHFITSDPLDSKAMMVAYTPQQTTWLFREPKMAAVFALMCQVELQSHEWPDGLEEFYAHTLPLWLDRNRVVVREAQEGGGHTIGVGSATAALAKSAPVVADGAHRHLDSGGVSGGRGLRAAVGLSVGIPVLSRHRQTLLFEYSGRPMEEATALSHHARPGETLLLPRDRERLVDAVGAVISLPSIRTSYHMVSVTAARSEEFQKVYALVPTLLRDRQAVLGEMSAQQVLHLHDALSRQASGAGSRHDEGGAKATSPKVVAAASAWRTKAKSRSSAQADKTKSVFIRVLKALCGYGAVPHGVATFESLAPTLVGGGEESPSASGSAPHESCSIESMEAFLKVLQAGERNGLVHAAVTDSLKDSSAISVPTSPRHSLAGSPRAGAAPTVRHGSIVPAVADPAVPTLPLINPAGSFRLAPHSNSVGSPHSAAHHFDGIGHRFSSMDNAPTTASSPASRGLSTLNPSSPRSARTEDMFPETAAVSTRHSSPTAPPAAPAPVTERLVNQLEPPAALPLAAPLAGTPLEPPAGGSPSAPLAEEMHPTPSAQLRRKSVNSKKATSKTKHKSGSQRTSETTQHISGSATATLEIERAVSATAEPSSSTPLSAIDDSIAHDPSLAPQPSSVTDGQSESSAVLQPADSTVNEIIVAATANRSDFFEESSPDDAPPPDPTVVPLAMFLELSVSLKKMQAERDKWRQEATSSHPQKSGGSTSSAHVKFLTYKRFDTLYTDNESQTCDAGGVASNSRVLQHDDDSAPPCDVTSNAAGWTAEFAAQVGVPTSHKATCTSPSSYAPQSQQLRSSQQLSEHVVRSHTHSKTKIHTDDDDITARMASIAALGLLGDMSQEKAHNVAGKGTLGKPSRPKSDAKKLPDRLGKQTHTAIATASPTTSRTTPAQSPQSPQVPMGSECNSLTATQVSAQDAHDCKPWHSTPAESNLFPSSGELLVHVSLAGPEAVVPEPPRLGRRTKKAAAAVEQHDLRSPKTKALSEKAQRPPRSDEGRQGGDPDVDPPEQHPTESHNASSSQLPTVAKTVVPVSNSFTDYCETEIFSPLRSQPPMGNALVPVSRPHLLHSASRHSTAAVSDAPDNNSRNSSASPPMQPGTQAYREWLASLNEQVREFTQEQQLRAR